MERKFDWCVFDPSQRAVVQVGQSTADCVVCIHNCKSDELDPCCTKRTKNRCLASFVVVAIVFRWVWYTDGELMSCSGDGDGCGLLLHLLG